jgi:hypothetical protein
MPDVVVTIDGRDYQITAPSNVTEAALSQAAQAIRETPDHQQYLKGIQNSQLLANSIKDEAAQLGITPEQAHAQGTSPAIAAAQAAKQQQIQLGAEVNQAAHNPDLNTDLDAPANLFDPAYIAQQNRLKAARQAYNASVEEVGRTPLVAPLVDRMFGPGTNEALMSSPGFLPGLVQGAEGFTSPYSLETMLGAEPVAGINALTKLGTLGLFGSQAAAGAIQRARAGDITGALGGALAFGLPIGLAHSDALANMVGNRLTSGFDPRLDFQNDLDLRTMNGLDNAGRVVGTDGRTTYDVYSRQRLANPDFQRPDITSPLPTYQENVSTGTVGKSGVPVVSAGQTIEPEPIAPPSYINKIPAEDRARIGRYPDATHYLNGKFVTFDGRDYVDMDTGVKYRDPYNKAIPLPAAQEPVTTFMTPDTTPVVPQFEESTRAGSGKQGRVVISNQVQQEPVSMSQGTSAVSKPTTVGFTQPTQSVTTQSVPETLPIPTAQNTPAGVVGLRSPISVSEVPEVGGNVLMPGLFADAVSKASESVKQAVANSDETFQATKNAIEQQKTLFENAINDHLEKVAAAEQTAGVKSQEQQKTFDADFINRIEMNKNDPARYEGASPQLVDAIRSHDALMEMDRQYKVNNFEAMGQQANPDFGITDQGYFPHHNNGDWRLETSDGEYIGNFETPKKANAFAAELKKQTPDLEFNPPIKLADASRQTAFDPLIPGQKFISALNKREGLAKYFDTNYRQVIQNHLDESIRGVELSKMTQALQPQMHILESHGYSGIVDMYNRQIQAIFGRPSNVEVAVGDLLSHIPVLRDNLARPEYALRVTARTVAQIQSILKLAVSPKQLFTNGFQPFNSLWPYVKVPEFCEAYIAALSKEGRALADSVGLGRDVGKNYGILDERSGINRAATGVAGFIQKNSFQRVGSGFSQRVGFLYGYKRCMALLQEAVQNPEILGSGKALLTEKGGFTPEQMHEVAVRNGRRWAEKVEYDNSVWNAPPTLRGWAGRTFGQFQGFAVKNLEETRNYFNRREGQTKNQFAGQVAKGLGVRAVGGGGKALIGVTLAVPVAHALAALVQNYMGASQDEANKVAELTYLGAGSLVSADLSGSFNIMPNQFDEAGKIVQTIAMGGQPDVAGAAYRSLSGPQGSTAADLANLAGAVVKEHQKTFPQYGQQSLKALKKVSPIFKEAEAARSMMTGEQATADIGKGQTVPISPQENIAKLLGFSPASVTEHFELGRDPGVPLTLEDMLKL